MNKIQFILATYVLTFVATFGNALVTLEKDNKEASEQTCKLEVPIDRVNCMAVVNKDAFIASVSWAAIWPMYWSYKFWRA